MYLLVLDPGERGAELPDHVLQLVVAGLLAFCSFSGPVPSLVRGRLPDVHGEHDDLWRHGAHLVGEAVAVHAVHVSRESVLAVALALALVDDLERRGGKKERLLFRKKCGRFNVGHWLLKLTCHMLLYNGRWLPWLQEMKRLARCFFRR